VVREWREELDLGVEVVRLLTVVVRLLTVDEHIYDIGEQSGHEVTFYCELRFAHGEEPRELKPLQLIEEDWPEDRQRMEAHWAPIADRDRASRRSIRCTSSSWSRRFSRGEPVRTPD
jgi:8-oxo-dGTP pyrophosphatase MutT (NUDIX family)